MILTLFSSKLSWAVTLSWEKIRCSRLFAAHTDFWCHFEHVLCSFFSPPLIWDPTHPIHPVAVGCRAITPTVVAHRQLKSQMHFGVSCAANVEGGGRKSNYILMNNNNSNCEDIYLHSAQCCWQAPSTSIVPARYHQFDTGSELFL